MLQQFGHWATPFARDLGMPSLNQVASMDLVLTDATGSGADLVPVAVRPRPRGGRARLESGQGGGRHRAARASPISRPRHRRELPHRALMNEDTRAGGARRWGMVIDLRRCVGCQTCTIACKQEHGLPPGTAWRFVADVEVGEYPDVRRLFLPMQCMHCAEPPCVPVCPTGRLAPARGRHRLGRVRRLRRLRLLRGGVPLPRAPPGPRRPRLLRRADAVGGGAGAAGAARRHDQVHVLQGARRRGARRAASCPARDPDATPMCAVACIAGAIVFGDRDDPTSRVSAAHRRGRGATPHAGVRHPAIGLLPGGVSHGRDRDAGAGRADSTPPAGSLGLAGGPQLRAGRPRRRTVRGRRGGRRLRPVAGRDARVVDRPRARPRGLRGGGHRSGAPVSRTPRAHAGRHLVDVARAPDRRRLRPVRGRGHPVPAPPAPHPGGGGGPAAGAGARVHRPPRPRRRGLGRAAHAARLPRLRSRLWRRALSADRGGSRSGSARWRPHRRPDAARARAHRVGALSLVVGGDGLRARGAGSHRGPSVSAHRPRRLSLALRARRARRPAADDRHAGPRTGRRADDRRPVLRQGAVDPDGGARSGRSRSPCESRGGPS